MPNWKRPREAELKPFCTIVESPFRPEPNHSSIVERNQTYLKRCILHSINLGETPFASHGFFTQFLSDADPEERHLGITLGYNFYPFARLIAFYEDYGMSQGMQQARIRLANNFPEKKIVHRRIGTNEEPKKHILRIPTTVKK